MTPVRDRLDVAPARSRAQRWILVVSLVLLALLAVYISQQQLRLNLDKAQQTNRDRFLLIETVLTASLKSGNFADIQTAVDQWGAREPELLGLRVEAPNGYVLGEYRRNGPRTHVLNMQSEIEYGYRGSARLAMTSDIGWVYDQTSWLVLQMLAAVALVGVLGVYFIRGIEQRQRRGNELQQISRSLTEANAHLNQERSLLRSLIDNIPDPIYIKDADGSYLGCNKAYADYTGLPCEQHLGHTDLELFDQPRSMERHNSDAQVVESGQASRSEEWAEYADGRRVLLDTARTPFAGPDGQLRGVLGIGRDITALKRFQEELATLAYHDPLTQLPNRRYLVDRMQHDMALAIRQNTLLAVCALDIDGFKPINDQLGHAAGDQVLQDFAVRLGQILRSEDTLARWGGDEFTILICGVKAEHEFAQLLERVVQRIAQPFEVAGRQVSVTSSIGVTIYPQDNHDADTLLRHADQAMYQAKQNGKNRYVIFDPATDRSMHSHMESVLRVASAIRGQELRLHYQPRIHMRSGTVEGVEVLVRWQHAKRGLLPPASFLPLISGKQVSAELDWWVLEQAVGQLSAWLIDGLQLTLDVNVSTLTLQQAGFADRLESLLTRYPATLRAFLRLEIPEPASLNELDQLGSAIADCQRHHLALALDDFGSGCCSFGHLAKVPVRAMKINRSLISQVENDPRDTRTIRGLVDIATTFERELIAKGVTSTEQGQRLLDLGCIRAQGNHIARPMAANDIPDWLASYRCPGEWLQKRTTGSTVDAAEPG